MYPYPEMAGSQRCFLIIPDVTQPIMEYCVSSRLTSETTLQWYGHVILWHCDVIPLNALLADKSLYMLTQNASLQHDFQKHTYLKATVLQQRLRRQRQ